MANFCSGVKVRLFGGAAGSMSSSVTSSFWARSIKGVELVKVMVSVLPVSPWREERLRQVSHVSLTDRDQAFGDLLDRVAPDLVHVVNNVHLPLDWPEVAAARGIPVVRSVTCAEDLCGMIAPVSPRSGPDGYCIPPLTPEHCARCLANAPDSANWAGVPDALARKRARSVFQFGAVFARIIFATPGFRHYFEQTLPLD